MEEHVTYTVFDESTRISLTEVCRFCRVDHERIFEMIQEGLLAPAGSAPQEWRFGAQEIKRIQITQRLQQDLGVNLPGAALALDLLDELERLRSLTKSLDITG
jgi:chaperone modulatory protein CbpM